MRISLLAAILAGAAGSAIAAAPDDTNNGRRDDTRAERAERAHRGEARPESRESDATPSAAAPRQSDSASPAVPTVRPFVSSDGQSRTFGGNEPGGGRGLGGSRERFEAPGMESPGLGAPGERAQRRAAGDSVRSWRMREREDGDSSVREAPAMREAGSDIGGGPGIAVVGGELVQPSRPLPRVFSPDRRRVSSTPVLGTEPPKPATATSAQATPSHRWRSSWRRDHRYDWRSWRHRHRSLFRLGFYHDPFGWDYFRYGIGWRLWPSYYRSSYWLHDPWHYRLPPSYGPYRWIRYHDDALLVNIYTGEVVDVIYDFFW